VNCAAIPKDLIESELFGYGKGAFSGASATGKKGLIEEAADGTLFLDEVGDLSLEAQAKLLRFLEEGEFYRVGETKQIRVRTRVVSATNKNVDEMMEQGLLRKDLYFRLGVIKIQVPSLNQRREDILPLATHFLSQFCEKFKRNFTNISPEAENALKSHKYTGNVRELRNLVERAVLTAKGPELTSSDFGFGQPRPYGTQQPHTEFLPFPPIPPEGLDLVALENALEKHYIEEAHRLADGNESQAARLLKLNHHTFRYRRKKLQSE
jgi:transcriptional regulator with PAS, ATPase and Fis domain